MTRVRKHSLTRSTFALAIALTSWACDSGFKQIGSIGPGSDDEQAGGTASESGDDQGDDPSDDGSEFADEDEGETGEACSGEHIDDDPECLPPQGVEIDFELQPAPDDIIELPCAANLEPLIIDQQPVGYLIHLTHCVDGLGNPHPDRQLTLTGDWPELDFADGDQPLTELRYFPRDDGNGQITARAVSLGSADRNPALFVADGDTVLVPPYYHGDLTFFEANPCDFSSCANQPAQLEHRFGFRFGLGCSESVVFDDTQITDFGIHEGLGLAFHILVDYAKKRPCGPDGATYDFRFAIVATAEP